MFNDPDIRKLIDNCTKYRTKGETKMNAVSSRSHAVLTLYITQQEKDDDEGFTEMFHKINLIDLAGSERARDTGARGQTLKVWFLLVIETNLHIQNYSQS